MYIIRADGNAVIGMGHIMRCLSIADAMKECGCEPVFVTACQESQEIIKQRGFTIKLLPTDYRRMETELPMLREILKAQEDKQCGKHVILVDSYQVTNAYYEALKELARVVCLEDMGTAWPVDMLINYNIYASGLLYPEALNTRLGTAYMPLRKEFLQACEYTVRDSVTDVMITTGGSDPYFAAKAFTEAFQGLDSSITYHVVSGPFNSYAQELKKRFANACGVIIHEHVTSMKELMKQCDVILTATGSTIYEVSALGVPMICFYFAENQRQGAEALAERTDIINAGNYAENPVQTVENAGKALQKCIRELPYRKQLFCQEKGLVDGKGAMRIAQAVAAMGAGL